MNLHLSLGNPRIWGDKNNLYVKTSRLYLFLNFYLYCKTVHVNKKKQQINIVVRKFWFITTNFSIPFNNIDYIDRELLIKPWGTGWASTYYSETYYVRIFSKGSPKPIYLGRFFGKSADRFGEWAAYTWVDGESPSDVFARTLSEYTGAKYNNLLSNLY